MPGRAAGDSSGSEPVRAPALRGKHVSIGTVVLLLQQLMMMVVMVIVMMVVAMAMIIVMVIVVTVIVVMVMMIVIVMIKAAHWRLPPPAVDRRPPASGARGGPPARVSVSGQARLEVEAAESHRRLSDSYGPSRLLRREPIAGAACRRAPALGPGP